MTLQANQIKKETEDFVGSPFPFLSTLIFMGQATQDLT